MAEIKCPCCGAQIDASEMYCIFCGAQNPNKEAFTEETTNCTPEGEKSIYGPNRGDIEQHAESEAAEYVVEKLVPQDVTDQEENVKIHQQRQEYKAALQEVEEKRQELEYLVTHDELTGVQNMSGFEQKMKETSKEKLCIIAIEYTSYNQVLEKMGQTPLDYTIICLVEALVECFGRENVYRESESTFLVALDGYKEAFAKKKLEELGGIIQRKNEALHFSKRIDTSINIDANAGVSCGDGIKTITELLDEAKRKRTLKTRTGLYGTGEGTQAYNANFDGYYDDVKAKEKDAIEAGLTKETIIKIVTLVVGLTVAVILFELSL